MNSSVWEMYIFLFSQTVAICHFYLWDLKTWLDLLCMLHVYGAFIVRC